RLAQGALSDAQAAVDEVLSGPDVLTLGSLWEPPRIAEICYRVLRATGDRRADEVLRTAAVRLEQQANQLADPARRMLFEQAPAHQALLAALNHEALPAASHTLAGQAPTTIAAHAQAWEAAPHVANIYGRQPELALLERWLVDDRCQLVALLGIGGV